MTATTTPLVLGFPESRDQAAALAGRLELPVAAIEVHHFPDGESRLRLPPSLPAHVVLVRSFTEANTRLVELQLATAAARQAGAEHLTLVAPYWCYMRQDTAFRPGEAVSQRIIGQWLAGQVDALVTIDPHLHRIDRLAQAVPVPIAVAGTAADLLGQWLAAHLDRPLLVGPDTESRQWLEQAAAAAGADYCLADKQRGGDRDIRIRLPARDYRDRQVVLVDDMASTGHTLMAAATALLERGARSVDAAITHALFVDDAVARLQRAGIGRLWSTDSIDHPTNVVPLAPRLAEILQQHGLV